MVFGARSSLVLALSGLTACDGTEGLVLFQLDAAVGPSVDAAPVPDAATMARDSAAEARDATPETLDAAAPVNITLSGSTATAVYGTGEPTAYVETCPDNQVLIGVRGYLDYGSENEPSPVIGVLEGACGVLALDGERVVITEGARLPERGRAKDEAFTLLCPSDQAVVRFSGRSGLLLDQLGFTCAGLTVETNDRAVHLALGETTPLEPVGGPGGQAFADGCAAGELARGMTIYARSWVGRLGLLCGTPVLERSR